MAVLRHTGDPEALAVGAGSVWVAEAGQDDVRRVDPVTHRVTGSIPILGTPSDVAIGDGSVWAITPSESRVWRIGPRTDAVTVAIDVAPQSSLITVIDDKVWVGSATGTIQRLDLNQNASPKPSNSTGRSAAWLLATTASGSACADQHLVSPDAKSDGRVLECDARHSIRQPRPASDCPGASWGRHSRISVARKARLRRRALSSSQPPRSSRSLWRPGSRQPPCPAEERLVRIRSPRPLLASASSPLLRFVHTDSGGSGSKRVVDVERTAASNLPWCLQTAVIGRVQLAASGRLRLLASRHEAG